MNQKFNFIFCKHHNDFEYCYNHCEKECPSISNLWYKFIRNPIVNFFTAVRYKFIKCNQIPTRCSFLYRNKYCLLRDRSCYTNREKSNRPYNQEDYEKAKSQGLDLDDWNDYVEYWGLGEDEEYL